MLGPRMISDYRLKEIAEQCTDSRFNSGHYRNYCNELLDEVTALRKIAEAATDAGIAWEVANFPHETMLDPMCKLKCALDEWRS